MAATRGGARQGRDSGRVTRSQGMRRAGHSGAVAVVSVMATTGATDAVWHVRGHGEPEREWTRGLIVKLCTQFEHNIFGWHKKFGAKRKYIKLGLYLIVYFNYCWTSY